LLSGVLIILLLISGCSGGLEKYSYEFTGSFDTLIQITGYARTKADFDRMAREAQQRFEELHRLFDVYNNYEGMNNAKTVNDKAGTEPVEVPKELLDVVSLSKEWYEKTNGAVNIALGPVLAIWHNYRNEGIADPQKARLPDMDTLKQAFLKSNINNVIADYEKDTVFLKDKGMRLDLGAVAKGYATEIVARELIDKGYDSFAISGGGNVRTVGKPRDGKRSKWSIGIQNPGGNPLIPDRDLLDLAYVSDMSVVSSGDYQRYYVVDDKRIHHIIDPATLMPAGHFRAVTIITQDSGIADILSTGIFILPYDEGRALVESLDGVEALWVMPDGSIEATEGLKSVLKNLGGALNK
jgi:thiamine biosynthesis lipoprotein